MRDSGALTELLLTRCTEKLRFPPQEAYGEATGITPWSARSIIWPMYARPIRIWRGVIPAVRSCSYPDGGAPKRSTGAGQRSAQSTSIRSRRATLLRRGAVVAARAKKSLGFSPDVKVGRLPPASEKVLRFSDGRDSP